MVNAPQRWQHYGQMNLLAKLLIGADRLLKILTNRERFLYLDRR